MLSQVLPHQNDEEESRRRKQRGQFVQHKRYPQPNTAEKLISSTHIKNPEQKQ